MSKQSLIEDTKIKKSGSRNEFGSYSLMTLKQFSASKTIASNFGIKFDQPIKEEFRPATAKLNNNSSNNKKRTSEASKYSFLHQVLVSSSTGRKTSFQSSKNSSSSNNALLPALLKTKELNLSFKQIRPSHKPSSFQSNKMDIFNLKTVEQKHQEQQQVVSFEDVKKETEKKSFEQVENELNEGLENGQSIENISYCSENTVELMRDAQDYFLEDDDRVKNEKLYLSEPKFHRTFEVKSARLPSLKEIEQKRNKNFNATGPTSG